MQTFREWLREKELDELNESPENLGDMNGLQSKEDFKNKVLLNFDKISDKEKKSAKKIFGSFKYIIKDNTFYIFREKLDLYIVFTKKDKTLTVKVVRNISDESNLSFKCYRAILDLPEFDEIITGDALSLDNLKSHKNALGAFKIYIRDLNNGKVDDKTIEDKWEFDYFLKKSKHNEVFVLKESSQLRYIRENLDGDLDDYLEHYFKELTEVQQTGNQERSDFSGEKEWDRLKKLSKTILSKDGYILYKYHDYLFLIKDDLYIAYLDGITDKLNSKKSFYITVMHSSERGAMDILFEMIKLSGFKYIVSDTMLSDDAIKYYKKLMSKHKYFGVNYKDETVQVQDRELLSNPDYRIVIIL